MIDESDNWIVVDKPAPLAVHPANGKVEPTLLDGLRALLACELADGTGLSIITRLDRETSGIVLVAKGREAAREFSVQFEQKMAVKEYLAIVHGWPHWQELKLEGPLIRAGEIRESAVWLRQMVHLEGKPCVTSFRVEHRFENALGRFALIRCFPRTGRKHQIRAHLEHLEHPIVGDKIYGTDGIPYLEQMADGLSDASVSRLILSRHALHATRLSVTYGGKILEWNSPLPPELSRFTESHGVGSSHG